MNKQTVLNVHITSRCDLFCRHCYNGKRKVTDVAVTQFAYIVKKAKEYFGASIDRINLLGGEPTLHPDFCEILSIAQQNADVVGISTNGAKIVCFADKLRPNDIVQVSIETLNEPLADWYRGAHYYSRFMGCISELKQQGIVPTVKLLIDRNTTPYIAESLVKLLNIGVDRVAFNRIVTVGNAADIDVDLTSNELKKVYDLLLGFMVRKGLLIHVSDGLWYTYLSMRLGLSHNSSCSALSNLNITIVENGDVYLCRRLDMIVGNIFCDDISTMLKHNPTYQKLIERNFVGVCGECDKKKFCGGCRACVKAKTGDVFESDSLCFLKESDK